MKTDHEGSLFRLCVCFTSGQPEFHEQRLGFKVFVNVFPPMMFDLQIDLASTIQRSLKTAVQLVVAGSCKQILYRHVG